jgi:adenylate cyclase
MTDPPAPVVVVHEPGRTPLHLVLREPLEVGRDCAGLLLDDVGVSRCHLVLRPEADHVVVADLGSMNGTTVDGRAIDGPVRLDATSVVRLGDTTIRLARPAHGVAPRPPEAPVSSIERVAAEAAAERTAPPAAAIREGTVTIVFTDIASSTAQAEAFGDQRWFEVLAVHNDVIRGRVAEHGGVEVKSRGDGFMLTFPSARGAAEAMIAVQQDMERLRARRVDHAIRLRVGAHTGEAIVGDDGDLFGLHVHIAARIADQAAGDEILVSSLVREITEPRGDLRFGEPRPTELKGLAGTFVLHPLLWRDPGGG